MMAVAVWVIVRSRNLFAVVVLAGIYSFLMATVLVAMDAVDVVSVARKETPVGFDIMVTFMAPVGDYPTLEVDTGK